MLCFRFLFSFFNRNSFLWPPLISPRASYVASQVLMCIGDVWSEEKGQCGFFVLVFRRLHGFPYLNHCDACAIGGGGRSDPLQPTTYFNVGTMSVACYITIRSPPCLPNAPPARPVPHTHTLRLLAVCDRWLSSTAGSGAWPSTWRRATWVSLSSAMTGAQAAKKQNKTKNPRVLHFSFSFFRPGCTVIFCYAGWGGGGGGGARSLVMMTFCRK